MVRFAQYYIAHAVDREKRIAEKNGRANVHSFVEGDLTPLSTVNLPRHAVTDVGSSKLLPKYIGLFCVLHRQGNTYTIELPRRMRTHPTLYVGRLRPFGKYERFSCGKDSPHVQDPSSGSCVLYPDVQPGCELKRSLHSNERSLC